MNQPIFVATVDIVIAYLKLINNATKFHIDQRNFTVNNYNTRIRKI